MLTAFAWATSLELEHSLPLPNDPKFATTDVVYGSMDGTPYSVTITTSPTKGTVTDNGDGTFTYTASPNQIGEDSFAFQVTESGAPPQSAVVAIDVTNSSPLAGDDSIFVPIASTDVIIVENFNDFDLDGDAWQIISVVSLGDGTASTDGTSIFYYPPTDPSNGAVEAKQELFVHLKYQIQDAVGAVAFAEVKNTVDDTLAGYRTYSPGNDDPTENIYETAQILVTVSASHSSNTISIEYIATASTAKKWPNSDLYEGQYWAENGFLRLFAAAGTIGAVLAPGTQYDTLVYVPVADPDPGIGGRLVGALDVATFVEGAASASGTAVIQMVKLGPNGWVYDIVRQRIPWNLAIENEGADERFTLSFTVVEVVVPVESTPAGLLPRLDTPLRKGKHDLYLTSAAKGTKQTPYPASLGIPRVGQNTAAATVDPVTPPTDWNNPIANDG